MVQLHQVDALMRKSWAYQRKNVLSNVCIILAPIVIVTLLGVVQHVLQELLDKGGKCGCLCIRCELRDDEPGDYEVSTDVERCNGPGVADCLEFNKDVCGLEYSDRDKFAWCAFPSPSLFPLPFDTSTQGWGFSDYDGAAAAPAQSDIEPPSAAPAPGGADGPAEAPGSAGWSPKRATELRMAYAATDSAFAGAMMQRFLRQPSLPAALQAAEAANLAQVDIASDWTLLATGMDFSFLSTSEWDVGSSQWQDTLFYMEEVVHGAAVIAADCEAFAAALEGARAARGNASDDDYADDNTVLGTLLQSSCVQGGLDEADGVDDLIHRLLCMHYDSDEEECPHRTRYATAFDLGDTGHARLKLDIFDDTDDGSYDYSGPPLRLTGKPIDRIVNAWLQEWLGAAYASRLVAQMAMPKPMTHLRGDLASIIGPLLYTWLIQLPLPWAVVQLVNEKQHRLRSMMRMHGLDNGAYIVVMYAYFLLQYALFIAVMMVAGAAAGLQFFRRNTAGVQIVFYFLYGNVQVASAFLVSCLFSRTRTANICSWIWILAVGILAQQLLDNMLPDGRWYTWMLQLIPTFGAYRAMWELANSAFRATYNNDVGMSFSQLTTGGNGMGMLWLAFALQAPVFLVLAWYLEQVTDSGIGVCRHWLFPFHSLRAWWRGEWRPTQRLLEPAQLKSDVGELQGEMLRERQAAWDGEPSPEVPVVVRDLRKEFAGQDGNPKLVAVKNLSLRIPAGECFGLLGPNGAGKSTSIHMMIGYLAATAGDVFINGVSIRDDMSTVYKSMGVCPQDNLLWETLTAQEHLFFYARLKRLRGTAAARAVAEVLRSVSLYDVRHKRASKFSGGMKRRLAVAISLIGAPRVVYLDEPSTGLDPAARRKLWEVVQSTKRDKAIMLTTHSMEEAEGLCDRIGIFVDGRLVCLGNPKQLTNRYIGHYMLTVTTAPDEAERMHEFVMRLSPSARRTYALGGTSKYEMTRADTALSEVFDGMAAAADGGMDVRDWGVRSATLEDVFVRVARDAEQRDDPGGEAGEEAARQEHGEEAARQEHGEEAARQEHGTPP